MAFAEEEQDSEKALTIRFSEQKVPLICKLQYRGIWAKVRGPYDSQLGVGLKQTFWKVLLLLLFPDHLLRHKALGRFGYRSQPRLFSLHFSS